MNKSLQNRRRLLELERKNRIFDEKIRTIGVDVKALNEQIEEKLAIKIAEKAKEQRLEREILENDLKALRYQIEEDEHRKFRQKTLVQSYIRPQTSGISRQRYHHEVRPFSHEFHVSSAQKFDGEDPDFKNKQKLKAQALKAELDEQLREKSAISRKIAAENEKWDKIYRYQCETGKELENYEKNLSKMMDTMNLKENEHLAREKNEQRAFEQRQRERENWMDVTNQLGGDFLNESRNQARSRAGPHRILPDRWKGMDQNQKEEILTEQRLQAQLKAFERERSLREKRSWEDRVNRDVHSWQLRHRHALRDAKEEQQELARFNRQLAAIQKARTQSLDREAKNNVPTKDFFNQFGTSIR